MGPEVIEVEALLAKRANSKHCLSCSSGTDALSIPLMAEGIGLNDAVFVPSFTFTSSAEVIAVLKATPIFVDVSLDTFNMCPESLRNSIMLAKRNGLNPKAIMVVDLFGQPVDFDPIQEIASENDLWILDDAAQSFGASYNNKPIGSFGHATATSFYPSKPLGCYGDGGAIMTNDTELYEKMRNIRIHGNGGGRGEAETLGLTARFDSIQAAILIQKLTIFDDECKRRGVIAQRYTEQLSGITQTPTILSNATTVWAQYTVVSKHRDRIASVLQSQGIPTALFYPKPLHTQKAYKKFPIANNGLKNTERLAQEVISLPMHAYLENTVQDLIIDHVQLALKNQKIL